MVSRVARGSRKRLRAPSLWAERALERTSAGASGPVGAGEMAKTNPFDFLQQVRSEAAKVTWPTRKETMITTAMVFVMVLLACLFFFVADQAMGWLVRTVLLGFGG